MCVIVTAAFAMLVHSGLNYTDPRVIDVKPKVGVVTGVVYSPGDSCAVVDGSMVREGDSIGDISVVGIQDNGVAFSKAGVTWQQEVRDTPNNAWTDAEK